MEKLDSLLHCQRSAALPLFARLILRHLPGRFLNLADTLLDFPLNLLSRVALDGAGNVVGFAFEFLGFTSGNIFASHRNLQWLRTAEEIQSRCQRKLNSHRPEPRFSERTHTSLA